MIAPTSSFVPIVDPFAERRLYLPFIGLLFITVEFLRRWKIGKNALMTVLALVLVAEGAAAYQRNLLWNTPIDMWSDTVSKSPKKVRPHFQLAKAYFDSGHYPEAIEQFQKTAQLAPPNFDLLLDWALAYDGVGKPAEAIAKLWEAAALEKNAHVYSQIGMEYGKMGQYPQALDALATSIQLDPTFFGGMAYVYRGDVFAAQGNNSQAAEEYRHAMAIDPGNSVAREKLARLGH